MRKVFPLSDTQVRTAKPGKKQITLFDGGGLYLLVMPSGSKLWRMKYRLAGKGCLLSLGSYPGVTLANAREKREEIKRLIAKGINPAAHREATRAAGQAAAENTFKVVALEWFGIKSPGISAGHAANIRAPLVNDLLPWIGKRPVNEITPPEILAAVRKIQARGAIITAHRALNICGKIFRYAIATSRAVSDPTRDLRGALLKAPKTIHRAATTKPEKIGPLLRMIDGYEGGASVRATLRLAPLLFVRPGELRGMEWADVDMVACEWRYTASKTGTPHIVPLSRQAVGILRELHQLTGECKYVFPGRTLNKPMSKNTVQAAYRYLGIPQDEMSSHGWRAVARTLLDETLGFPVPVIEMQLAHAVADHNRKAYNRTEFLDERKRMMQVWADYLDKLKGDPVE